MGERYEKKIKNKEETIDKLATDELRGETEVGKTEVEKMTLWSRTKHKERLV